MITKDSIQFHPHYDSIHISPPVKVAQINPSARTPQVSIAPYMIPMMSVYPNRICLWNSYNGYPIHERYKLNKKISDNQAGKISSHAANRIKKYVNWLVYLSKRKRVYIPELAIFVNFKINFITLSLPSNQIHSDKEIKDKCLNHFFQEIRYKYKSRLYLWKAEAQANGNIHFHITLDKFIWQKDLRDMWNRIINKLGYVDVYRDYHSKLLLQEYILINKKSATNEILIKRYQDGVKCGWTSPNSTDIHSVKNIRDLPKYLSKYFTKNEVDLGRRKIEGNLWYCSELLSSFNACQIMNVAVIDSEFRPLWDKFKDKQYIKDFICLIKLPIYMIDKYVKASIIVDKFNQYIADVLGGFQLSINEL